MSAFIAMTVANLKMTLRNRAALFWLLAFPIIFIVLFGYLLNGSSFSTTIGVTGANTPQLQQVVGDMKQIDGFKVETGTKAEEMKALNKGNRDVVVVFTPSDKVGQTNANIYYSKEDAQTSQVTVSAIQQFFSATNQEITKAPQPIVAQVQSVSTDNMSYIDFLVPGILAMSIMTNGMMGLAGAFVSYREKGILRRINATPFPLPSFIMSKIVTQIVIAILQAVILLGVGKILFNVKFTGDIASLAVMLILGAFAFLAIGFLISSFAPNSEVADAVANAISFPMMFLSGVFFPVSAAPAWLKPITEIMPLTYFANGLRDIMIHGSALFAVWTDGVILLGVALAALAISVRFFRWDAKPA